MTGSEGKIWYVLHNLSPTPTLMFAIKLRGSAVLSLLKARSYQNSLHGIAMGTYLFATGAQRQHYGVFGSLGMTASWTTIVDSAGVKF